MAAISHHRPPPLASGAIPIVDQYQSLHRLPHPQVLAALRAAHGLNDSDHWMLSALEHKFPAPPSSSASAQQQTTLSAMTPPPTRLNMDLGSFYIPKEGKHRRGEDAHFLHRALNAFGVADGVGGWTNHGIDPGEFARQLMSFCQSELEAAAASSLRCSTSTMPSSSALEGVLSRALARTTARGTSTACLAVLDGGFLHAVNIGDSGFLVVRRGELVYHSPSQQSSFNRPYQVGRVDGGDPPELACKLSVEVLPGDVVIAGSDGLFDNLFDAQILDILADQAEESPGDIARALAWAAVDAYLVGEETPFSMAYREAGCSRTNGDYGGGGKPDDVTVVVAVIW